MLHYAPDDMVADAFALAGGDWCIAWQGGSLADDRLLPGLMTSTREVACCGSAGQTTAIRVARSGFKPERLSGFCAAG